METENPRKQTETHRESPQPQMSKEWEKAMNDGEETAQERFVGLGPTREATPRPQPNLENPKTLEQIVLGKIEDGSMEILLKQVDGRKQGAIELFGNKFEATIRTKKEEPIELPELPKQKDEDAISEETEK